jgi:hypothetical protein
MRTIHGDKYVSQIYNALGGAKRHIKRVPDQTRGVLQRAATLQRYGSSDGSRFVAWKPPPRAPVARLQQCVTYLGAP